MSEIPEESRREYRVSRRNVLGLLGRIGSLVVTGSVLKGYFDEKYHQQKLDQAQKYCESLPIVPSEEVTSEQVDYIDKHGKNAIDSILNRIASGHARILCFKAGEMGNPDKVLAESEFVSSLLISGNKDRKLISFIALDISKSWEERMNRYIKGDDDGILHDFRQEYGIGYASILLVAKNLGIQVVCLGEQSLPNSDTTAAQSLRSFLDSNLGSRGIVYSMRSYHTKEDSFFTGFTQKPDLIWTADLVSKYDTSPVGNTLYEAYARSEHASKYTVLDEIVNSPFSLQVTDETGDKYCKSFNAVVLLPSSSLRRNSDEQVPTITTRSPTRQ
ncbi:MAG: hypothetical protein N2558_03620 [Patescibacteria group bacterium]|nr:hypothetical protein [Patescibacteria group bacterium]